MLLTESNVVEMGSRLSVDQLRAVERELHLKYNKWDTQIGDINILSDQPLILPHTAWDKLCRDSEQLAQEIISLENHVLANKECLTDLGISPQISDILGPSPDGTRNMRFDFHLTKTGWTVSEVNSDVPGGWREGTVLPRLYQPFYPELSLPQSPLDVWGDAVQSMMPEGLVVLLHAPGYLEDQQVALSFMDELHKRGMRGALIQSPATLEWSQNECKLRGQRVALVIRFYQMEWLCLLPAKTGWKKLIELTQVPVINPARSVISESKRFPLFVRHLDGYEAMKRLMPESRDTREIDINDWGNWALKACFSNTGDHVYIFEDTSQKMHRKLIEKAMQQPRSWVAQRRFETIPVHSSRGLLYPCIGVFVVNGKAAGAYVRLSSDQVTDYKAIEAPLLLKRG